MAEEANEENRAGIIQRQRDFLAKGGIVYDQEFLDLERQDRSGPKIAIDLDETLTSSGEDVTTITLRPGASELLDELRKEFPNVKLVLWTSRDRETTGQVLDHVGLAESFDLTIANENYLMRTAFDYENDEEVRYPEVRDMQNDYPSLKPIFLVGYDLLLDGSGLEAASEVYGFKYVKVEEYDPQSRYNKPIDPQEMVKQVKEAL